jgi:hypothetical protein
VAEPKPRRGWLSLYVAAFALLLTAGMLVAVASLDKLTDHALQLLRVSMWVSAAAVVAAVASVVLPRRR